MKIRFQPNNMGNGHQIKYDNIILTREDSNNFTLEVIE